ncbi:MAG: DUF6040 family protein [Lachnospiraceae bacterium]|nr:DUF6040 family protein [Lachnospiraceae bacterium]
MSLRWFSGHATGYTGYGFITKKRWCSLSLRVLLTSLAAVILFGEGIHEYVSINLCLLYLLIQIAFLCCLRYLDGCYENRNKTVEWKRIQNM